MYHVFCIVEINFYLRETDPLKDCKLTLSKCINGILYVSQYSLKKYQDTYLKSIAFHIPIQYQILVLKYLTQVRLLPYLLCHCENRNGGSGFENEIVQTRGVDVHKRTVTMHSCSLLQGIRFGHNISSCLFSFSFFGHILA